MADFEIKISEVQLEQLRDYLDRDCQMHLAAPHHCWRLDSGKLMAALEHAGIGVALDDRYSARSSGQ